MKPADVIKIEAIGILGSAAASDVVRCALAPNFFRPITVSSASADADDEGVVGCTRGGRAPQCAVIRQYFLPLPMRNEWGEDRGEGNLWPAAKTLLSPTLSSIRWRRGRSNRRELF